jgi:hypothetical protein
MPVATRALRALLLAGALGAFPAGLAYGQGDGSFTDNPDLLRGSFSPFCEPAMLCHYNEVPPPPVTAVAPPVPGPLVLTEQQPPAIAAPPAPPPLYDTAIYPATPSPVWRATYGVALRGSFVHSGGANRYEALLIPNAGMRYDGQGTQAAITGSATIVQPYRDEARIGAASVEGNLGHALGPTTRLDLDGVIAVSQDDPRGLDVVPSGAMTAPLEFRASADAALTQQFGRFDLTGSVGVVRNQTGETRLAGGGVIDNSGRDRTRLSGGMRLGYRLTPIFGVFVSGDAAREEFDRISPDIGVSRSGWDYALRGGITANWHDTTTFEASIGSGWRTYDAAALAESQSQLYAVAFGYSPDPSLRLRAAFDTAIEPGTGGVVASVDHTLSLEVAYKINQWLGLRGTASGSWSEAQGTGALTRRYAAGVGADLALGPHSDFTIDYGYGWRGDPVAVPEVATEHRVSAGVSLQY